MSRIIPVIAIVSLILLAGCTGVSAPTERSSAPCGEAAFVFSQQDNAIDDFSHLNVTITTVELKRESASSEQKRVTKDIKNRRVDLVQLRGERMTILENATVPDGTYKKAFLSVRNVTGTLASGAQADVAVRHDRLKVKKQFVVSGNESLTFGVQPTVVQRDGKYIVKPRLDQSGCGCC